MTFCLLLSRIYSSDLMRSISIFLASFLAILLFYSQEADSASSWPRSVLLSYINGDVRGVKIASNQDGSSFVAWYDYVSGKAYVNKVDSGGRPAWPHAKLVAITPFDKMSISIVSDGMDGLIAVWAEGRNGKCYVSSRYICNIYGQRFDAAGKRLWGEVGLPMSIAPDNYSDSGIPMIEDGQGGAIFAWQATQVRAQHVTSNGTVLWGQIGKDISRESPINITFNPFLGPKIASDGSGGAYIGWVAIGQDEGFLRVRHIDGQGLFSWKPITVTKPSWEYFGLASDGKGGAFLTYPILTVPVGISNHSIQRVSRSGELLWGRTGKLVSLISGSVNLADTVPDGDGGAYIVWYAETYDYNYSEHIFAQHVDAAGARKWGIQGLDVSQIQGKHMYSPRIVKIPNKNEFIVGWFDCRNYERDILSCEKNIDIYGQAITSEGVFKWRPGGVPIDMGPGSQGSLPGTPAKYEGLDVSADMAGGVTFVWPDGRFGSCSTSGIGNCTVFARRVTVP